MSIQGPLTPGKPYCPSNGTEGEIFMEKWCYHCTKDNYPNEPNCPIIAASMSFEVNDPNYPKEWIVGANGWGMCTAFEPLTPPAKETVMPVCERCHNEFWDTVFCPDCYHQVQGITKIVAENAALQAQVAGMEKVLKRCNRILDFAYNTIDEDTSADTIADLQNEIAVILSLTPAGEWVSVRREDLEYCRVAIRDAWCKEHGTLEMPDVPTTSIYSRITAALGTGGKE